MTSTTERAFRFGVNMMVSGSRSDWVDKCRKAEDLGYDVIGVADHLGMPAPFPAIVSAAEATERVRLCPFVLNAGFYNPVLLARDAAGTDQLVEGRLELGLGTGYVKAEFDAAGLPFPGPRERLDHLEHTLAELRRLFADGQPRPAQEPHPPLLLGGHRDRMLRMAAREADIVGFTGIGFDRDGTSATVAGPEELAERVEFVRKEAGERFADLELNLLIQHAEVTDDRAATLDAIRAYAPDRTVEELAALPIVLVGTAEEIAEQLLAQRKAYGISYVTVMEAHLDALAPVIPLLR
ncbi:LLM class F420-dependent oxidoreductase [Prauserella sp. PE36]|uniref:LLM class F420-dependent oxidoreductase n=1 Tax=Prauserella sp. PE36 TaxID=1504709 RepID=UPI000DE56FED|nr:LLM class F420-dependent oxidoreductase [Prauserella sp. PE36]RBM23740.1 LLM class F420-dependent oxidoreductase [Prauserella sp. PE36]